jgi:hypothetical protein
MDPYVAEVVAKMGLHHAASGRVERLTGRVQHVVHDWGRRGRSGRSGGRALQRRAFLLLTLVALAVRGGGTSA